ncbi:MAG: glycyl-radical enzyme activating protein [Oscillospiraceae bacterium]|nr:glycyl-radical enzyme activating protein [Oscillospiraceae bacterium]
MTNNNLHATLFDIQSFSVQDGPGVRLTLFFKGCPLNCPWCHSPESQAFGPELNRMEYKCVGVEECGRCTKCPHNALSLINTGDKTVPRPIPSLCVQCFHCVDVCPAKAFYICGKEYTVDDLMTRIRKEKPFFTASGGGVTVSGGECLCQPEFVLQLLAECKKEDIHTAVDTTGYVSDKVIKKILPYTDLFLYDLKHMDSDIHKAVVGVPNELILENAKLIAANGGKLQIRIPVIPGFNESEAHFIKLGEFIADLGSAVESVQLLPYHTYGEAKYRRLFREPPEFSAVPPDDALMQSRKELLEQFGLTVTIH